MLHSGLVTLLAFALFALVLHSGLVTLLAFTLFALMLHSGLVTLLAFALFALMLHSGLVALLALTLFALVLHSGLVALLALTLFALMLLGNSLGFVITRGDIGTRGIHRQVTGLNAVGLFKRRVVSGSLSHDCAGCQSNGSKSH